jgi:hypothetical protein
LAINSSKSAICFAPPQEARAASIIGEEHYVAHISIILRRPPGFGASDRQGSRQDERACAIALLDAGFEPPRAMVGALRFFPPTFIGGADSWGGA